MANALAKSKAVLDKQSASLTPWSVYLASFPKSREVLDIDADLDTIDKDLPRLTPQGLQVKQLGQLAAAVHSGQDWEVTITSVRKILHAFLIRHSNIGYVQGMHTSVLYLLIRCAGDEEATFWAFCVLVEDAHARDFYAKPPAAMNGFLIDSEILAKLARKALPEAPEYFFEIVVPMIAPKLLIPALVDQVPVATLDLIYDRVYSGQHMLLLPTLAVLIAAYLALDGANVTGDEDDEDEQVGAVQMYIALQQGCSVVTPEQYDAAFTLVSSAVKQVDLPSLRLSVVSEMSARWLKNCPTAIKKLSSQVHFDVSELSALQKRFQKMKKKGLGIDREGLAQLLNSVALPRGGSVEKISPEVVDRIFDIFDNDDSGEIDFREVVCCLSVLTRGSTEQRLRLLFDIFDTDESGFLEGKEIAALAGAVMKGAPKGQADAFRRKVELTMDANKDGEISFLEFFSAVRADPIMMNALGISMCGLSVDSQSPGILSFASNGQSSSLGTGGHAFRLSKSCLPGENDAHKQSDDHSGKCCNCCVLM